MFTGIVREIGRVRRLTRHGATAVIEVDGPATAGELSVGDSVAVAGACLTVTEVQGGGFAAQLSDETLAATTLGAARPGQPVDLEPAMQISDRLGGHLVTGHVDGVGTIVRRTAKGEIIEIACRAPSEVEPYLIAKGSVAMDGVSLTVVDVDGDEFTVTLIAHTAGQTTLGGLKVGDRVNLEADLIGKYVRRFTEGGAAASAAENGGLKESGDKSGGLTEGRLRDLGYK